VIDDGLTFLAEIVVGHHGALISDSLDVLPAAVVASHMSVHHLRLSRSSRLRRFL